PLDDFSASWPSSNCASENGLSFETCGRACVFVTPRSASKRATGLDVIADPRSAWIVSCPRSSGKDSPLRPDQSRSAAPAPPTGRRSDGALYQAALLEPILIGNQLQATGLPLLGFFQRSVQIVALDMELLSQKPSKLVEPVACTMRRRTDTLQRIEGDEVGPP